MPKKLYRVVFDFETYPIRTRPHYPPKPVGFSLKLPSWRKPEYYAFAHPTGGNNCAPAEALAALRGAYDFAHAEKVPLLGQNLKFDLDVAEVHMGLALPGWELFDDTMFLLFLDDPHQRELGLKPSAQRLLGMKPEEQDKVKDWVLEHKKQLESDYPEIVTDYGGIKPSTAGAFVAYAPAKLVAPYANGDVERTDKLFQHLYNSVCVERGMKGAYEREKRLLPILLRNEREGLRIDVKALERDQGIYEAAQEKTDNWLRKALKAPALDFNKDAEVAKALKAVDAVTEWTKTETGRDSVSKKNLKISHFRDRKVAAAFSYRTKCATMLETFIRPWQRYTVNGRMHTNWNQVRQSKHGNDVGGTRTGRPSTDSPNFLNVPRNLEEDSVTQGFLMPTHLGDLPRPAFVRRYVIPDEKNHVVVKRDFIGQELRLLAHAEDGPLLAAFQENPLFDVHKLVQEYILKLVGVKLDRYATKRIVFGYIYGQGISGLCRELDKAVEEVKSLRNAMLTALPGLPRMNADIKRIFQARDCIRTWGGREYYCEPPVRIESTGRWMTFEYKGMNVYCQGSAADVTKEVMIRYDEARQHGRMMLTVYDELDLSVPKVHAKKEALLLRDCMLSIDLDVPLLSECAIGPTFGDVVDVTKTEPKYNLERWGL